MVLSGIELVLWLTGSAFTGTVPLSAIGGVSLSLIPLLLIYWFAETIVDLMTPKSDDIPAATAIRHDDLQAIAFSMVGLYILYMAVMQTIGFVVILGRLGSSSGQVSLPIDTVLTLLASWIIGLYLLIGAPAIRRWIGQLRRAGTSVE